MVELKDTIDWMVSDNYEERLKAECWQLRIRWKRLHHMLNEWDEGKLEFEPTCPREMLQEQCNAMDEYLWSLEECIGIEGIDIYGGLDFDKGVEF